MAALIVAPVPDQQTAPPPPAPTGAAADAPVAPPAIAVPAPQDAPPASAASPNASPDSTATEFADPLSDPATLTPEQAKAQVAAQDHYPGDPLEGFNRAMFALHMKLDKALYRPVAMGYKHIVPKPARSGLRNFFSNLTEPIVFLNYLLQLKIGKAARTLVRFTVNTTMGVGGLIDVAKVPAVNLPHHDNNFGNTLAFYGVKPGAYLFLPLMGPTTLRDVLGGPVDGAVLPVAIGRPFTSAGFQLGSGIIPGVDLRAETDPQVRALFGGAVDPYATLRSVWLQNRAAEVADLHSHKGAPDTPPELGDPLSDPAAPPAAPPSTGSEPQPAPPEPAKVPQ